MHIPMVRDEIASFLEVKGNQVDILWSTGKLQKTLHCPYRPIQDLSHSTIYDVLEYALTSGDLPVSLPREIAALWVAQLAEANEWEGYASAPLQEQVEALLLSAKADNLTNMTLDPAKVAYVAVLTQAALGNICQDLDIAG